jgi:hypothetical protein
MIGESMIGENVIRESAMKPEGYETFVRFYI